MNAGMVFPDIDPIIFSIGPFAIRWYALSYIAGLLIGIKYLASFVSKPPNAMAKVETDDFLVWLTLGVIIGGRLGYVLFYNFDFYLMNPLSIIKIWQGGMSFHGGLTGVILAIIIFCRRRGLNFWLVGDAVACASPIGLFFGRIANFINGELYGRASDVPWSVIFPGGGPISRHPSQIYEALLEGLFLFCVLFFLSSRYDLRNKPGFLAGVFLIGYAVSRSFVEIYREPDAHIGYFWNIITMGQLLSVPLFVFGVYLLIRKKPINK